MPFADNDEFFYPVTEEESDIVIESGIHPIDRKKVHLSTSIKKAIEAGSVRTDVPIILRIDGVKTREEGVEIYQATDDVCVTDHIDAKYISKVDEEEVQNIIKNAQSKNSRKIHSGPNPVRAGWYAAAAGTARCRIAVWRTTSSTFCACR